VDLFKDSDKKILIDLSLKNGAKEPKVVIGDLDISSRVRGIKIAGGVGRISSVELELLPEEVDITIDQVPIILKKSIKDFSLEDITKELQLRLCRQLIENSYKR